MQNFGYTGVQKFLDKRIIWKSHAEYLNEKKTTVAFSINNVVSILRNIYLTPVPDNVYYQFTINGRILESFDTTFIKIYNQLNKIPQNVIKFFFNRTTDYSYANFPINALTYPQIKLILQSEIINRSLADRMNLYAEGHTLHERNVEEPHTIKYSRIFDCVRRKTEYIMDNRVDGHIDYKRFINGYNCLKKHKRSKKVFEINDLLKHIFSFLYCNKLYGQYNQVAGLMYSKNKNRQVQFNIGEFSKIKEIYYIAEEIIDSEGTLHDSPIISNIITGSTIAASCYDAYRRPANDLYVEFDPFMSTSINQDRFNKERAENVHMYRFEPEQEFNQVKLTLDCEYDELKKYVIKVYYIEQTEMKFMNGYLEIHGY